MFPISELFKAHQRFEKDHVLFCFKGIITKELLDSVCQILDSKMESLNEELRIRKKVNNVLIESMQNMFHHVDAIWKTEGQSGFNTKDAIFMIQRSEEGEYSIFTGNYVLTDKCEVLKSKIDQVNSLGAEALRDHYVDKLSTTELSEKGGAGLGFIDIARKSGNKLIYEINEISDEYSFFSLHITVSKKVN